MRRDSSCTWRAKLEANKLNSLFEKLAAVSCKKAVDRMIPTMRGIAESARGHGGKRRTRAEWIRRIQHCCLEGGGGVGRGMPLEHETFVPEKLETNGWVKDWDLRDEDGMMESEMT